MQRNDSNGFKIKPFKRGAPPAVVTKFRKLQLIQQEETRNCILEEEESPKSVCCGCYLQSVKKPRVLKLHRCERRRRNSFGIFASKQKLSGFVSKILSAYWQSAEDKRKEMLAKFDFLAPLVMLCLKN